VKNPLPCPDGDGAFFTLNLYGAEVGPDGVTRGAGNGISVAAAPAGLARLLASARPVAVQALFAFLNEGDVSLINSMLRVEVEGWGREWLTSRGYSSNQAQDAVRDLRDAGWIRTEQNRGLRGWVGPQVGVLSGSVYGSGEVYLAAERRNRMPATNPQVSLLDGTSGTEHLTMTSNLSLPDAPAADHPAPDDSSATLVDGTSDRRNNRHRDTRQTTEPATALLRTSGGNVQVSTVAESAVNGAPGDGPSASPSTSSPSKEQSLHTLQSLDPAGTPAHQSLAPQSKESAQSFQDLLRTHIKTQSAVETACLWQRLQDTAAGIVTQEDHRRAVELVSGVLLDSRAEFPTAAAEFLDLHHNSPVVAARAIADYVVTILTQAHHPEQGEDLSGRIRAFIRSKNIVLKEPVKSTPLLPAAWSLAVLAAATTHMSDPKRYLYSALHRPAWEVREPLPRLAEAFDSITVTIRRKTAGAPDGHETSQRSGGVVDVLSPPVDGAAEAMLEEVLSVLADHFRAVEEDLVIWRKNARIRGMMSAQFTVSHQGITPEEFIRLRSSGLQTGRESYDLRSQS
jgi:hypothetical protein